MANPKQEIKYTKLFINNEYVDAKSGKTFATFDPSTKQKIADVAEGDKADVDLAVAAAKKAFARGSEYRKLDANARAKLLFKLAALVQRDAAILANLESLDLGKPYQQSYEMMIFCVECLKSYGQWADKYFGETIPAPSPLTSFTWKDPVGVVGQIIPWNAPLLMFLWKIGPAIAAGCTVVIKLAEQTPLSGLYMGALIKEAGFLPGVINIISGYGPTAGAAISEHMDINKVAFTGSVETGKIIMQAAARTNLKRVTLELGGKSPLVVDEDVDIDEAAKIAYDAIFGNSGQICCAGSRTFVHEKIYDKFVEKAVAYAKQRKVGGPFEAGVEQGPQIDEEMYNKVLGYIESGKKNGAQLACGGKPMGNNGYFIEPTVFTNVTDDMQIAKEEIFGPVQSILKYKTLEEVIERANNTTYGLAAGIITKDINKALTFAQAAEAGTVWINCYNAFNMESPFGGFKQSGLGRESGKYGIDNYVETKTVTIKLGATN